MCTDVQWERRVKTVSGGVDNVQFQEVLGGGSNPTFSSERDVESSAAPPESGSVSSSSTIQ